MKWKPKVGEMYYFPIIHGAACGAIPVLWQGSEVDNKRYKAGVVCRERDETVEMARKMLAVAKERVQND